MSVWRAPVVGELGAVDGVLAGAVHAHEAREGHAAPHEAEQDQRRVEQEGRTDLQLIKSFTRTPQRTHVLFSAGETGGIGVGWGKLKASGSGRGERGTREIAQVDH